ncbi:MAG: RyR domain-containing protein [Hyphomicrobiaceae bacterium]
MDETYEPKPLDTTTVKLAPAQRQLVDALARNAHEVWAAKRVADGWVWGERRDDANKQHPCLIPYEQLPDSEKAYDIEIVEQTLKAALALGYKVSRR